MKLTPWEEIELPELTPEEYKRLEESIKEHGLQHPIIAMQDGRIIDGKNRWVIVEGEIPKGKLIILDISEEEAKELAYSLNLDRRQLNAEQIAEAKESLRKQAVKLVQKGMTQQQASKATGVPRTTIEDDIKNVRNDETVKTNIPDHRKKVTEEQKREIVERAEAGETHTEIAKNLEIKRPRVSQIIKEETQKPEPEEEKLAVEEEFRIPKDYEQKIVNAAKELYEIHENNKNNPNIKNEMAIKFITNVLKQHSLFCPKCGKSELEWSCCHTKIGDTLNNE